MDFILNRKGRCVRKLIVFNHVTLDGYFVGANGDMSWAHEDNDDPEFAGFVAENASGEGELLFGRVTYDMMAGYWPTAIADQHNPVVAKAMNRMAKVVFSRTLKEASWNNTRLVRTGETRGDLVSEVRKLKEEDGPGMAILGSGSIVAQLAQENLIDEYQMVVNPLALGKGRSMFDGIRDKLSLKLTRSRTFKNGKVFLCYEPA
jgi:dihydrofolate reductase